MSCSKGNLDPEIATFKFTAGNTTYVWNGDLKNFRGTGSHIDLDTNCGVYNYSIIGMDDSNSIGFNIVNPMDVKIAPGTFTGTWDSYWTTGNYFSLCFNDLCPGYVQGDSFSVTITNVHDNMVNGIFSAYQKSPGPIQITNGEFQNMKMILQ
jgi:hypothetical protein